MSTSERSAVIRPRPPARQTIHRVRSRDSPTNGFDNHDDDDHYHHQDNHQHQQSNNPMAGLYRRNHEDTTMESTRLGPIADTIITTLSQDNLYNLCFVIVEILGVILIALCTAWMFNIGGFGFDDKIIFNFHPLCMTLGMVFLNANGILLYRSTKNLRYQQQKILHFALQTSAIVVSWIGFFSAYLSHAKLSIPHFYSLHSWLGLSALIGVTISLLSSFLTFLYPKANSMYRQLALPFHVFGGIANIALSAGICAMGITEKAIFTLNQNPDILQRYPYLPPVAVLLNMFGIILIIFTILVVWMVTKPEFKRKCKVTLDTHHYVLRREKTFD